MDITTFLGLFVITGGATLLGATPVIFHRYLKDAHWVWLESFGGGVMTGASLFSLILPAVLLTREQNDSYLGLLLALLLGILFIFVSAYIIKFSTRNVLYQKAYLFVFVMGLHNVPEGLAVGVDVAGIGWEKSLPLTSVIFIQNLPEGFVSAMIFLVARFSLPAALIANGITAMIETISAYIGFSFVSYTALKLPDMLAFAGACMLSVVVREILSKARGVEAASFSYWAFTVGVVLCAALDLIL
jgi:ZIP family zinc transporter